MRRLQRREKFEGGEKEEAMDGCQCAVRMLDGASSTRTRRTEMDRGGERGWDWGTGRGQTSHLPRPAPTWVGCWLGFRSGFYVGGGVHCLGCINFDSTRMRVSLNFGLTASTSYRVTL